MKSSNDDLRKRGFISTEDVDKFQHYSNSELILLINSPIAVERSIAINLLSNRFSDENLDFIKILLERLTAEKCLYTKIEICNSLEKGSIESAKLMIPYLGRIGKNQHLTLPEEVSKKKSYPLPRDIIARSLGRMDCSILPVLFDVLNDNNEVKISEIIDAIGFLLFYSPNYANENYLNKIIHTLNKYAKNDLIVWKCTLCLSSFKTKNSINILNKIISNSNNTIKSEAKRSLRLIVE